jgi:hypothetical protein
MGIAQEIVNAGAPIGTPRGRSSACSASSRGRANLDLPIVPKPRNPALWPVGVALPAFFGGAHGGQLLSVHTGVRDPKDFVGAVTAIKDQIKPRFFK